VAFGHAKRFPIRLPTKKIRRRSCGIPYSSALKTRISSSYPRSANDDWMSLTGRPFPTDVYAGDILHHQPLRHEIFNDAQIFAKKPASWIVQSTLVVVDAIGLAGGPPIKQSSSPLRTDATFKSV